MAEAPSTNDEHVQGYVDGVRDCAAWAGQYAASALAEADALERQGEALIAAAQRMRTRRTIGLPTLSQCLDPSTLVYISRAKSIHPSISPREWHQEPKP